MRSKKRRVKPPSNGLLNRKPLAKLRFVFSKKKPLEPRPKNRRVFKRKPRCVRRSASVLRR